MNDKRATQRLFHATQWTLYGGDLLMLSILERLGYKYEPDDVTAALS
jgi:hypothetical protein